MEQQEQQSIGQRRSSEHDNDSNVIVVAADDEDDRRHMNDSTMPLSERAIASAKTASPKTASFSAASLAAPGKVTATASVVRQGQGSQSSSRQKVPPSRRGFGLSDWTRLLKNSKDLALRKGAPLRHDITWDEIQTHNSVHDGWMVLRNKVYFISPYLMYHPGGSKILHKSLGQDGTALFDKYHRWVNEDGLVGKLLIGYVDTKSVMTTSIPLSSSSQPTTAATPATALATTTDRDGFAVPLPKPPRDQLRRQGDNDHDHGSDDDHDIDNDCLLPPPKPQPP